jgi:hypothetical protein
MSGRATMHYKIALEEHYEMYVDTRISLRDSELTH